MREHGFRRVLNFRDNALGQDLAELNTPLIERVDVPDGSFREDRMFIQSNKLRQHFRRELFGRLDGPQVLVAGKSAAFVKKRIPEEESISVVP